MKAKEIIRCQEIINEALEKYREFLKLRDKLSDLDKTGEYMYRLDELTINEWI